MSDTNKYKRLYRSRKDKVIGGVCGGLGGYLNLDPVVIRVIWLAAILIGGMGVLAYLIAWILIPESPAGVDPGPVERHTDGAKILGIVLIVVSLFWLSTRFFGDVFVWIPWGWLGPLALVALGVALLIRPSLHRAADYGTEAPFAGEQPATPEPEAASTEETDEAKKEAESGSSSPFETPPLRRSRRDRVLLGVCGGLAKMWHVDATVIRVIWAIGTVLGAGVLLIAYLVMALVIPDEEERYE